MALVTLEPYDQPTRAVSGTVIYRNGTVQTAMRSRSYPTVPKHLTRNPSLNEITILSERWELLSNAQRIGWGNYAYTSPLIDAWGNDRYIRGYAHYMRSNRPRAQFGFPIIDDPPTTPGLPDFTITAFGMNPGGDTAICYLDQTDDWVHESGSYILAWASQPAPANRTRPPENYRPAAWNSGDPFFPPQILTVPLPTKNTPTSRAWLRLAVSRADGRYTSQ